MTKVIVNNLNNIWGYKERIFALLVVGIIVFASYYALVVHSTVVYIIDREKVVKDIHEVSTRVSELESSYFSQKNQINIELAHAKGFEDAEVSSYITKRPITAFVSHNEL